MKLLAVVVAAASTAACHSTAPPAGTAPDAPAGTADAAAPDGAQAPACVGLAPASGDTTWTLTSGGLPRVANVHVPPSYDPTRGMPVVFNFHGFTSDAVQEAVLTAMSPAADAEGYIVIYPYGTGTPLSWNAGACCGTATATNVDDIGFVKDLLALAEQRLCIDPARVYATGMSNGGFLSHRIGCELADTFAAIAPVAGVDGMPTCNPSRPVPVMEFHGTADPLVPYNGSSVLGFDSVPDTFTGWATRDGCTGAPVQTYAHGDATCMTYQGCDVTLCTIDGGGHTWPGGLPVPALGVTSTDISATDAMWTFFAAHHL
ncbi:MAG TPA: PHB depolymerase family esterase [Kofleriaceae bacterium]|nr:PHB depolymerase family esterase [Kofleriaceae bacterium]